MRRVLLALVILVLCVGLPEASRARGDGPDFSAFAGRTWYHHGAFLTVDASGLVETYGTPGTPWASQPPSFYQLDAVVGNAAFGHSLDGANPIPHQMGVPTWLVLLPFGMVLVETPLDQIGSIFCEVTPGAPLWPDAASTPGLLPSPC